MTNLKTLVECEVIARTVREEGDPSVPIFLVGTKKDALGKLVGYDEAAEFAEQNQMTYLGECSPLTGDNMDNIVKSLVLDILSN